MKKFCIQIFILSISVFFGAIFILVAYSLPVDKMRDHVQDALYIYEIEHNNHRWGSWQSVQTDVDNFTNCIMLMEAIYPTDRGITDSAFSNRMWNLGEEKSPYQTLINVVNNNLGDDKENSVEYARYWHGYLIFLKPLLSIMDTGKIRVLNFQLQFLLIVLTMILIYKRLGIYHVVALSMAIIVINPVTTALSFQNSTMLYITLLSIIYLLLKNESLRKNSRYIYFFLIVGICTAYFDFLTYPFVSLGISLCIFAMLNRKDFFDLPVISALKKCFHCIFSWSFGYVGMWASKWILATIFTEYNILADAFINAIYTKIFAVQVETQYTAESFSMWDHLKFLLFSAQNELPAGYIVHKDFTFFDVVKKNIHALDGSFIYIFAIFILYMIFKLIINRQNIFINKTMFAVFGLIISLPFIWYAAIIKHSYIHDFLVYRELSIAIFGISCLLTELLNTSDKYS